MQDKKEKILTLLSIILPISIFVLLAVVIGLILSAAFRVIDTVQTTTEASEFEDTRRKITVGDMEYPVSDDAVVDRVPSVRSYLDGILESDFIGADEFMDGVRHVHEEGQNLISLEDLTPYEYRDFMDSVYMTDLRLENNLLMIHRDYPMEIMIPINEYNALTVYKLLDGDTIVYVYIQCAVSPDEDAWYWNPGFYPVTERLTYEDVASLQVGDTLHTAAELCPAIHYQIRDSKTINPYFIVLEEGILGVSIDEESISNRGDPMFLQNATISKLYFAPLGDVLTEAEKTDLGGFCSTWFSEIPYILLPE